MARRPCQNYSHMAPQQSIGTHMNGEGCAPKRKKNHNNPIYHFAKPGSEVRLPLIDQNLFSVLILSNFLDKPPIRIQYSLSTAWAWHVCLPSSRTDTASVPISCTVIPMFQVLTPWLRTKSSPLLWGACPQCCPRSSSCSPWRCPIVCGLSLLRTPDWHFPSCSPFLLNPSSH